MTAPSTPPVPVVVVPREPSGSMQAAGRDALEPYVGILKQPVEDQWHLARLVYAAMLSASPEAIGGGALGSSLRDTQPGADGAVVGRAALGDAVAALASITGLAQSALSNGMAALSAATPVQRGGDEAEGGVKPKLTGEQMVCGNDWLRRQLEPEKQPAPAPVGGECKYCGDPMAPPFNVCAECAEDDAWMIDPEMGAKG